MSAPTQFSRKYLTPALWIVAFQVISYGIGLVTRDNMGWYDTLDKSPLTPPDIAFPIVWSTLYVLLALAGLRVWRHYKSHGITAVFVLFWMQMGLNWGWSFVFFAAHEIALGFYWIVALNVILALFIIKAWNSCRRAAVYTLPTLLWGCFAAYLNYMIMILN